MHVYRKMCNEKECVCVEVYCKICESKKVCENVYMFEVYVIRERKRMLRECV